MYLEASNEESVVLDKRHNQKLDKVVREFWCVLNLFRLMPS